MVSPCRTVRTELTGRAIAAVIFDLDGVLVDSESAWDQARRAVVTGAGQRWPAQATTDMQGMSSPEWSRYLHDQLGVDLDPDRIAERVVEQMLAGYQRVLPLIPGAVEAVERISQRWPLGLASSSNRPVIDALLSASGLTSRFRSTVSSEEVARGKPAPDVYLAAASALGVLPAGCAAIEDSANGLRAAHAAGMVVVAFPNRDFPPGAEALALATVRIHDLAELTPELLDSLSDLA